MAAGHFVPASIHGARPDWLTPVQQPVAQQLPRGFELPPADLNLKVVSVVAADLDADGDLDIVATDDRSGSLGVVVWVNDGGGHLRRQRPAHSRTLGSEPAPPSFGQQQADGAVSIQAGSPAVEPGRAERAITLPSRRGAGPGPFDPASADRSARRSRSPPVLS
jgi:hypothetical protein